MAKETKSQAETVSQFRKSVWGFAVVFAILVGSTGYLLAWLYRTSTLLVDANRLVFQQEVSTRATVVNQYLSLAMLEMDILADSPVVDTYYHNRALGMSLEYGLAVSISEIQAQFRRYIRTLTREGDPVFLQIALFDLEQQHVIAGASATEGKVDTLLLGKVARAMDGSMSKSVCNGSECRQFVAKGFKYKGRQTAYLLIELNLPILRKTLIPKNGRNISDFTGLVNPEGILIVGPPQLVGAKISDFLGVSLNDARARDQPTAVKEIKDIGGTPLIVESESLGPTGFHLVRVAPTGKYMASHSEGVWTLLFVFLMSGVLLMLAFTLKGYTQRYEMYVELEKARNNLELRVEERTADLAAANLQLHQEIDERRKVEEALRESEEKYRQFLEFLPQFVFEMDLEGKFIFANRSGLEAVGLTREDLERGVSFPDLLLPADHEMADRHMKTALEEGGHRGSEYQVLRKDGSTLPVVVYTTPVRVHGKITGLRGIGVDLTQQKRVEEELRKARELSEALVEQRTAELRNAYEDLVVEISERKRAQTFLQERERFLSDIFESIQDGITVLDSDLNVIRINKTMERWYSHAMPIVGRKCYEAYQGRSLPCEICPTRQTLDTAGPHHEVVPKRREGREITGWLDVHSFPLVDSETGDVKGVIEYVRDVTDQKMAEEGLKEAQLQQKAILDNIPDMAWLKDRDSRFVMVNESFGRACGVPLSDLVGKTDLDIWPSEQAERYRADDREVLESGRSTRWEEHLSDGEGNPYWIETIKTPIFNEAGEVIGTAGIARDITERKQSEDEISRSEKRYRSLFEISADAIVLIHPEGTIMDANIAACQLLGAPREELIETNVLEFYSHPGRRKEFRRILHRDGYIKGFEWKVRRKDGIERDCILNSALWTDEAGNAIAYVSSARDVTEARSIEQQLRQAQKMEAIGALAGGIAHDFNNLLTIILGYSELLLLDQEKDTPGYTELQAIRQTAERGADLVKRILAFSRKLETAPRPINLNQEVKQARELLSKSIPKMVAIELRLADKLDTVNADPGQIEQILLNLAVNAKDAMPEEGGKIVIETKNVVLDKGYCDMHPDASPGAYVLLSVSDTGHGMTNEVLEHIFEPFYTTKEPGKGTGLGLAMVYGIVKGHGGHIICDSAPGAGTTFSLYFPAIPVEEEADTVTSGEIAAFGTETILLVDDEELVRDLGAKLLSRVGYTVLKASGGHEALATYRAKRDQIALVILDLVMPEMGGKECLEKLLSIDPKAKVLIASGYSAATWKRECIDLGARGFVAKPFRAREFLGGVRRVLDER